MERDEGSNPAGTNNYDPKHDTDFEDEKEDFKDQQNTETEGAAEFFWAERSKTDTALYLHENQLNELVLGTPGNDHLKGQGGRSQLYGGKGDDILEGNGDPEGADLQFGGPGNDTLYLYHQAGASVDEKPELYIDTLRNFIPASVARGGSGADRFIIAPPLERQPPNNKTETLDRLENLIDDFGEDDVIEFSGFPPDIQPQLQLTRKRIFNQTFTIVEAIAGRKRSSVTLQGSHPCQFLPGQFIFTASPIGLPHQESAASLTANDKRNPDYNALTTSATTAAQRPTAPSSYTSGLAQPFEALESPLSRLPADSSGSTPASVDKDHSIGTAAPHAGFSEIADFRNVSMSVAQPPSTYSDVSSKNTAIRAPLTQTVPLPLNRTPSDLSAAILTQTAPERTAINAYTLPKHTAREPVALNDSPTTPASEQQNQEFSTINGSRPAVQNSAENPGRQPGTAFVQTRMNSLETPPTSSGKFSDDTPSSDIKLDSLAHDPSVLPKNHGPLNRTEPLAHPGEKNGNLFVRNPSQAPAENDQTLSTNAFDARSSHRNGPNKTEPPLLDTTDSSTFQPADALNEATRPNQSHTTGARISSEFPQQRPFSSDPPLNPPYSESTTNSFIANARLRILGPTFPLETPTSTEKTGAAAPLNSADERASNRTGNSPVSEAPGLARPKNTDLVNARESTVPFWETMLEQSPNLDRLSNSADGRASNRTGNSPVSEAPGLAHPKSTDPVTARESTVPFWETVLEQSPKLDRLSNSADGRASNRTGNSPVSEAPGLARPKSTDPVTARESTVPFWETVLEQSPNLDRLSNSADGRASNRTGNSPIFEAPDLARPKSTDPVTARESTVPFWETMLEQSPNLDRLSNSADGRASNRTGHSNAADSPNPIERSDTPAQTPALEENALKNKTSAYSSQNSPKNSNYTSVQNVIPTIQTRLIVRGSTNPFLDSALVDNNANNSALGAEGVPTLPEAPVEKGGNSANTLDAPSTDRSDSSLVLAVPPTRITRPTTPIVPPGLIDSTPTETSSERPGYSPTTLNSAPQPAITPSFNSNNATTLGNNNPPYFNGSNRADQPTLNARSASPAGLLNTRKETMENELTVTTDPKNASSVIMLRGRTTDNSPSAGSNCAEAGGYLINPEEIGIYRDIQGKLMGNITNDAMLGTAAKETMDGGCGNDLLDGSTGNDVLAGGNGNDVLDGGEGNDVLYGGKDNDILSGDEGHDTLAGGPGNDILDGGPGQDVLHGGAGNDNLKGDSGDDLMNGGAGNDYLEGGEGNDIYTFHAGAGIDHIIEDNTANGGFDTLAITGGVLPEEITFIKDGVDLIISLAGKTDQQIIPNQFKSAGNWAIESFKFDGETRYSAEQVAELIEKTADKNAAILASGAAGLTPSNGVLTVNSGVSAAYTTPLIALAVS